MTEREWPFGPFLRHAIEQSGLSKRAIARAAGISDARLRQLEDGYRKEAGGEVPVSTTPQTVAHLSRVLGFPLAEGLSLLGLAEPSDGQSNRPRGESLSLSAWSVPELLYELRERFDELTGAAPHVPAPPADANTQPMTVEQLTARAATIVELEELAERRRAAGDEDGAREVAQLAFDLNRQMHALAEEEEARANAPTRSSSSGSRVERPRC